VTADFPVEEQTMRKRSKRLIAVLVATAAMSVAGLVYAAWTTTGSGSSYAKAGTAQALSTVDVSASTTGTLYPGATGDVLIKVSNPNPYPVRVTGVSLNGANSDITPDAGHSGCTTTGVSFSNQTGLAIDVAAKSGGVNGTTQATLNGGASMSNASVDACQGATFTIPVTLSGTSNG
jgi:hypothetical protein